MADVKKLTVTFLILAVIVSSSALVLTYISGGNSNQKNEAYGTSESGGGRLDLKNAFVDIGAGKSVAALASDDGNMSKKMARSLAKIVVALNPDGATSTDGGTGIAMPAEPILNAVVASNLPLFDVNSLWKNIQNSDTRVSADYTKEDDNRYAENFKNALKDTILSPKFLDFVNGATGYDYAKGLTVAFDQAELELKRLPVPAPFASFHKNFLQYLDDEKNIFAAAGDPNDPLKNLALLQNIGAAYPRIGSDFINFLQDYGKLAAQDIFADENAPLPGPLAPANIGGKKQVSALSLKNAVLGVANLFGVPSAKAFNVGGDVDWSGGQGQIDQNSTYSACDPTKQGNVLQGTLGGLFSAIKNGLGLGSFGGALSGGLISSLLNFIPGLAGILSILSVPSNDQGTRQNSGNQAQNGAWSSQIGGNLLTLQMSECNQKQITEQSKKALNQIVQDEIVSYIQNNGSPRFITNYENYIGNSYTQGANAAYAGYLPEVCQSFTQTVQNVLSPGPGTTQNTGIFTSGDTLVGSTQGLGSIFGGFGTGGISGIPGQGPNNCTIENVVNPGTFYNDFSAGGWDAYMLLLQPQNNLIGSIIIGRDRMLTEASNEAGAADTEAKANNGYRADTTCNDFWTDPSGNQICMDQEIVTPGDDINHFTDTAIKSGVELTVSAEDFNGLEQSLAQSLVTELPQQQNPGLYGVNMMKKGNLSAVCGLFGSNSGICSQLVNSLNQILGGTQIGGILGGFGL